MAQTDSPLGTAPVGKLVLQLAIPAMLAQFVNILYSVVDRMYVGHIAEVGADALAGVGEGTVALKQLPGGETVSVDADIVVMALGNRPDKAYEDKMAAAFDKVIVVGDATKAGTMADATKAAYEKCFYI